MENSQTARKSTPPWVWVGCGCVGALGALVLIVVGLGYWGVQTAREFEETMTDPTARNDHALEVLGADALPDGYHTVAAFSVPFVFDYAVLSDQPPENDGRARRSADNGFIFMSFPALGDGDEELYDFFEGRSEDVESLRREQFNLDLEERVAAGRMTRENDELVWVSHRGTVDTEVSEASLDGLVTMMLFECSDSRRRVGIWFGSGNTAESEDVSPDLSGTVADALEIEKFIKPLDPCH